MTVSKRKPKGRLAPSPTGNLHLGHAFSFIHAYWQMRRLGGSLILRQEDLDVARSSEKIISDTRTDLKWLGLSWQEERLQSAGKQRIIAAALKLKDDGKAYYCSCTRGDLKALGAPHMGGEIPYPEICRAKALEPADALPHSLALRFQVMDLEISFEDQFQGHSSNNPKQEVGDFPILRKDGSPAYQLAVTIDDYLDGVTHVLRGADLLSSTSRQILIQKALGYPSPQYAHVPLIADSHGVRLAKRSDALSLATLREAGIQPETLIDWVASISGLPQKKKQGKGIDSWLSASREIQFPHDSRGGKASNHPHILLPSSPVAYFHQRQSKA